jgi:hypothetical protein
MRRATPVLATSVAALSVGPVGLVQSAPPATAQPTSRSITSSPAITAGANPAGPYRLMIG